MSSISYSGSLSVLFFIFLPSSSPQSPSAEGCPSFPVKREIFLPTLVLANWNSHDYCSLIQFPFTLLRKAMIVFNNWLYKNDLNKIRMNLAALCGSSWSRALFVFCTHWWACWAPAPDWDPSAAFSSPQSSWPHRADRRPGRGYWARPPLPDRNLGSVQQAIKKNYLVSQKGGTDSAVCTVNQCGITLKEAFLKSFLLLDSRFQFPTAAEFALSFHAFLIHIGQSVSHTTPLFWRCSFPVHVGVVLHLCPVGWPDPCAAARCLTAPQAPCWCWSPLHPTNPHLQCPSKSSVCPLRTNRQHRAILLTHSVTYIHAVGDDFHLRAVIILLICVWMCAQRYQRSQLIPFCLQTPMNLSSSPTSRSGPLLGLLQLPHHYPGSPDL